MGMGILSRSYPWHTTFTRRVSHYPRNNRTITMSSKLNYAVDRTDAKEKSFTFPCLREHKTSGAVYLFSSLNTAVIITGIALGTVLCNLDQSYYKPVTGTVHLTEE